MTLTPARDAAMPRSVPRTLAALDEPMRRYVTYAIGEGAALTDQGRDMAAVHRRAGMRRRHR